jgi:hypothetical protein
MAFLDNSGDIILDAVLTDTGRFRLAKGDGSFKIAKFALADDEINYELYNKNHSSGSAYYDLEILQTPILEAFTNNTSSVKHRLMSVARTNLLYLPVIKINDQRAPGRTDTSNTHCVAVDKETEDQISTQDGTLKQGTLFGERPDQSGGHIELNQGLNTNYALSPSIGIDADLVETQYIIQIDNRFGSIVDTNGSPAAVSFIDDDNVATYYLSLNTDPNFVSDNKETGTGITEVIKGPRGTTLKFAIQSSIELNTSEYLFEKLGNLVASADAKPALGADMHYIDSIVRVAGATTGYSIDIPVRFFKKDD